jgi:MEMO1 family protein
MIRQAVFEGRFYPDTREEIFSQITSIERQHRYGEPLDKGGRIIGAVLPHAGHIYSGYQTIPFFQHIRAQGISPETFIILHPNHTGAGADVALDTHDAWKNAVGTVAIDTELSNALPYPADRSAHINEHSAEVIVPFIQYYYQDRAVKIVPVCIRKQTSATAGKLARDLHAAIKSTGRSVLIIASSDFSHFLSPERGYAHDQLVLEQIENRDIDAVEQTVIRNRISICGYGPVMTLMAYAEMDDRNYVSKVIARGHSGEVFPSREVVDYISILFQTRE